MAVATDLADPQGLRGMPHSRRVRKGRALLWVIISLSTILFGLSWYLGISAHEFVTGIPDAFKPPAGLADTTNVRTFECSTYSLLYPGNWEVDTDDDDFDADRFISIDAAGQGSVMLGFAKAGDSAEALERIQKILRRRIIGSVQTREFSQWGMLSGSGAEVIGRILFMGARVRLFAHESTHTALIVVEIRFDEDEEYDRGGYDLVSRSFRFK